MFESVCVCVSAKILTNMNLVLQHILQILLTHKLHTSTTAYKY